MQDINNLRGEMAKYYNLFSLGIRFDPVVSVPYIDAFGTGNYQPFQCSILLIGFHFFCYLLMISYNVLVIYYVLQDF